MGVPFQYLHNREANDFLFGTELVFAKAHHKITPRGKSGHSIGLGEPPEILWFHFNIFTMAEARDLKFSTQLGYVKANHKTITREKEGVALG